MILNDDFVIPEKTALPFLEVFEVVQGCPVFDRWRRNDGFRVIDFDDVLGESPRFVIQDWRGHLDEALTEILAVANKLGLEYNVDLNEDGDSANLEVSSSSEKLEYNASEGDNFNDVIFKINTLFEGQLEIRSYRRFEGSDCWAFAILTPEEWNKIEVSQSELTQGLFRKLCDQDAAQTHNERSKKNRKWWKVW